MEDIKNHALEMNKTDFANLADPSNSPLDRVGGFMRMLGRLQLLLSYNLIDQDFYKEEKAAIHDEVKRLDALEFDTDLDRKFRIFAWNRSGTKKEPYTQADGVFFLARDPAFRAILPVYRNECAKHGAGQGQLDSLDLLISRIGAYAEKHPSKVADADPTKEPHLFK